MREVQTNGGSTPDGMEHQTREFASIRMPHFVIKEHQKLFPKLAERMRNDPANATNTYSLFLAIVPIKTTRKMSALEEQKIARAFNLIK